MDRQNTPPSPASQYSLPYTTSTRATWVQSEPSLPGPPVSKDLTQAQVETNSQLRRLQKDLLILTGLNENETIHWRPSWFEQGEHAQTFWTLYNPPNVVTESLPQFFRGRRYFTRRMRSEGDPPALFIQSWDAWNRYRALRGIPREFLSEEQITLMRLGLPRNAAGQLCRMRSPQPRASRDREVYTDQPSSAISSALPGASASGLGSLPSAPFDLPHPSTTQVPLHQR